MCIRDSEWYREYLQQKQARQARNFAADAEEAFAEDEIIYE